MRCLFKFIIMVCDWLDEIMVPWLCTFLVCQLTGYICKCCQRDLTTLTGFVASAY